MEPEKQEHIVRVAARVFGRHGIKASIDEIAREAGVAKGTVYLACKSKEDLYYRACLHELMAWVAEVRGVLDPRVPADELLVRAWQTGNHYIEKRPLVRELLFGNVSLMLPEWSEQLDELRRIGRTPSLEVLELGVR